MDTLLSKLPYTKYCERQGSSAWTAEPVNVLSAIVLFISAYCIFRLIKKKNQINKKFILLPLLLVISALGNVIYHAFPNPLAYLVDIGSLGGFWLIILYLLFLLESKTQKIKGLFLVGLALIVAVYLRSLDKVICNNFIIGTHFILHILIAIVAYFAVKSLLNIYESREN